MDSTFEDEWDEVGEEDRGGSTNVVSPDLQWGKKCGDSFLGANRFGFNFVTNWDQVIPSAGIDGRFVENVRPSRVKLNTGDSGENIVRTVERCSPFHHFPPNYGGKLHQGFDIIV